MWPTGRFPHSAGHFEITLGPSPRSAGRFLLANLAKHLQISEIPLGCLLHNAASHPVALMLCGFGCA
jgi:hypothetical protein